MEKDYITYESKNKWNLKIANKIKRKHIPNTIIYEKKLIENTFMENICLKETEMEKYYNKIWDSK